MTTWIHRHLPMASRSDASQNDPMSPFYDVEIIFCDMNFLIKKRGGKTIPNDLKKGIE